MIKEEVNVPYDRYIKILEQIQQFEIMQEEAKILGQDSEFIKHQLGAIEYSIDALRQQVPLAILSKFDQLCMRTGYGVIDLVHGKQCGACRVSLVPDNLKRMELNKISPNCHSCGKFIDVWVE
jgi:predicted  nucleic acid-binding Zn-ribbon protein